MLRLVILTTTFTTTTTTAAAYSRCAHTVGKMASGEPNCVAACGMLKTSLPIEMHTLRKERLTTHLKRIN